MQTVRRCNSPYGQLQAFTISSSWQVVALSTFNFGKLPRRVNTDNCTFLPQQVVLEVPDNSLGFSELRVFPMTMVVEEERQKMEVGGNFVPSEEDMVALNKWANPRYATVQTTYNK